MIIIDDGNKVYKQLIQKQLWLCVLFWIKIDQEWPMPWTKSLIFAHFV